MAWSPDYATVEELRDYVRIPDSADDVELALAIAAASRAIDQACNRQFGNFTGSRIYTAVWDFRTCRWVVRIDDATAVTAVAADWRRDGGFDTEVTDWVMGPVNQGLYTELTVRGSLPDYPDAIRVTGSFGLPEVPGPVKMACLLQAARLFKRRDSPYGIAGSPEMGSELRLLAKVDPDVEVILRPYRRIWGAL